MDVPDLVCFDLPCLVDVDAGAVDEALDRCLRRLGVDPGWPVHAAVLGAGIRWPGLEARASLLRAFGSEVWADAATAALDDAFGSCVVRRGATVAEGAREVAAALRHCGVSIGVTTDFSAATREAVLDVLEWPELVATFVSRNPLDALPQPGAVETVMGRLGIHASDTAVVSDSCSGVAAARQAGVGWIVGLPGRRARGADLRAAGADSLACLAGLGAVARPGRLLPA